MQVQSRLFVLESEQVANGLADDAAAGGFAEKTISQYRAELREQEKRIVDKYADLLEANGAEGS